MRYEYDEKMTKEQDRGICRNKLYRWDEETMVFVCYVCGMFSSELHEMLNFHYWKIRGGKIVDLKLPAEKQEKITGVTSK